MSGAAPSTTGRIEEFFADLARLGYVPSLARVTGTVRIEIIGEQDTEHRLITIRRGHIEVSRNAGPVDCLVRVDRQLLERIFGGSQNAMVAMLRDELGVQGNPELLVLIQRLFRHQPDDPATAGPAGGGAGDATGRSG
jgi:hypothetical protein